jgi:hypothetical protein
MKTSLDLLCVISHPAILFYHHHVFYNIHMRLYLVLIFILILLLSCCGFALPLLEASPTITSTPKPPTATAVPVSPPQQSRYTNPSSASRYLTLPPRNFYTIN